MGAVTVVVMCITAVTGSSIGSATPLETAAATGGAVSEPAGCGTHVAGGAGGEATSLSSRSMAAMFSCIRV